MQEASYDYQIKNTYLDANKTSYFWYIINKFSGYTNIIEIQESPSTLKV